MPTFSQHDLQEIFKSPYKDETWIGLLRDLFKATQIRANWEALNAKNPNIDGYYIGKIETSDHFSIGLFYFKIKQGSVEKKRVGLRNLVKGYINPNQGVFDAALAVFVDDKAWRLSLICDIKEEKTEPKRFTFVFGNPELNYRTAASRFELLQNIGISFENLMTAFSVEALSDDFFNKYRENYAAFVQYVTGMRYVKVDGKWQEVKVDKPDEMFARAFNSDAKCVRDYIKKMMGRITFLHFLQRKGWMGGDLNYMQNLFKRSTQQDNFLDAVLEPLFYGILNTKPENRAAVFKERGWDPGLIVGWQEIPYLNGGLFERDATDEPDSVFPKALFQKLFNFFGEYNFTIDENDPNDAEIGVDPEMLGKIFENLLEDNKDKGAFYTPKEIVQYMCRESLITYLLQRTQYPLNVVHAFVCHPDEEIKNFSTRDKVKIERALSEVKICDPAIGSGAFPMGMLNELLHCRAALVGHKIDRAALKREIISQNIYGVDIEKGAVDIARLRFWLSIVVDEISPSPLPNLDYKIMQGDSLVESYMGCDLSKLGKNCTRGNQAHKQKQFSFANELTQGEFIFDESHAQDKMQKLTDVYYNISEHDEKRKVREAISATIREYIKFSGEGTSKSILNALASISIPNDIFFLWHTFFGDVLNRREEPGFDIVIGNPPYVSTKGVSSDTKKKYEMEFGFSDDLYNLFFFQGIKILKEGGALCFITSKTFWTTQTKRNLRNLLLSKTINFIVDTGNPFEDAMVDTCITCVTNNANHENHEIKFYDGKSSFAKPSKYTVQQSVYSNTQNCAIFVPTTRNLQLQKIFGQRVKELHDIWWNKIKTSKDIEENSKELSDYRRSLKPGDIALLGCLTDGGQGLATANNGKYLAVKENSKWADRIRNTRPEKLALALLAHGISIEGISPTNDKRRLVKDCSDFLSEMPEAEIGELFDSLKEKFGRDIFGRGYIYKIASTDLLADVDSLSQKEKEDGIQADMPYYVPYDKGDKDGNRWFLDTPYVIAWTQENVRYLKTNSGKKGEGMPVFRNPQFYFKEGFCWNNVLNPSARLLKVRLKGSSVNDVGGMSLCVRDFSLYYILAYLNSNIIFDYYREFINCTVNVQMNDLRQIPVIVPTCNDLQKIESLVKSAILLKRCNNPLNIVESSIDKIIADICINHK